VEVSGRSLSKEGRAGPFPSTIAVRFAGIGGKESERITNRGDAGDGCGTPNGSSHSAGKRMWHVVKGVSAKRIQNRTAVERSCTLNSVAE